MRTLCDLGPSGAPGGCPGLALAPVAAGPAGPRTDVLDSSSDPRLDGVLYGERWSGGTVSYGDPDAASDYEADYWADNDGDGRHAPAQGMTRLSTEQLAVAHATLNSRPPGPPAGQADFSVEGLTDLDVRYAGSSPRAVIRLANSEDPPPPENTAYAYFPAPFGEGGDAWFDGAGPRPEAGNYDYVTMVHEIGHTLGLKHPHEAFYFEKLPARFDALEFTVMSYRSFVGDDLDGYEAEAWSYPQSYMMLDIAALQHMYGADFGTRAGDTVYAWGPDSGRTLVDGAVAVAPGGNRIFLTLWDGGGTDCYDLSAYSSGVRVDLAPGASSVFAPDQLADLGGGPNGGRARGNIYNALQYHGDRRSLIEDAIGGAGDDDIRGNQAANRLEGAGGADALRGGMGSDLLAGGAGDDTLEGGKGADRLIGGAGRDVLAGGPGADAFVFDAIGPCDVIRGDQGEAFEGAGQAAGDVIDLAGIDADWTREGDQAFAFGGWERGRLGLKSRDGDTLVCGNVDGDRSFELLLAIEDGSLRSSDYRAEDFVL